MTSGRTLTVSAVLAALAIASVPAGAATLRIGMQEDPDALDPDQGGTYAGRAVFAAMCDKLVDITPDLDIVPVLATGWEWSDDNLALTLTLREGVVFHDGEPFDAEAVKYNIERSKTLGESKRKGELAQVESVEVVDGHTARLHLSQPFAPLLAQLTDRAGMMISPKAAEELGADFPSRPACSGPYEFVERIAQDSIRLKRFDRYWNPDEIHIDEVVYRYIEDPTVRLAALQAGDIDIAERVSATDLEAVRNDPNLELVAIVGLGFTHLHVNTGNGPRSDTPLGESPRLREALELALDREVINQVAFNGENLPGNQLVPPTSPYYIKKFPPPARDVERARQILAEEGHERLPVELAVVNSADNVRVAQIVQALAGEAGFDVTVLPMETATSVQRYFAGDFELYVGNWSGRADPDGNLHAYLACDGSQNHGRYCNPELDELLNGARAVSDPDERYALYEKAAAIYLADRPTIPIYHLTWFFGVNDKVEGLTPYPDALTRLQGMRIGS
ncbi:MAG TPA: ABC transporter substrate-binding protein [Geminicoccaceae bacterium]|nr:ABC transporter substrate-binding protein [Geminicoccaceae bacterium]